MNFFPLLENIFLKLSSPCNYELYDFRITFSYWIYLTFYCNALFTQRIQQRRHRPKRIFASAWNHINSNGNIDVKLSVSFVFWVSTQHSFISCVFWVCRIRVAYGKYKNNAQHAKYNLQMKYALWLYLTEKWAEIRAKVTPIIKSCP